MGQHDKPVPPAGRRDTAVVQIHLDLVIPKDYRDQFTYPTSHDAGEVAKELMRRWERGELPTQELLEMADRVHWQVTKPSRVR